MLMFIMEVQPVEFYHYHSRYVLFVKFSDCAGTRTASTEFILSESVHFDETTSALL